MQRAVAFAYHREMRRKQARLPTGDDQDIVARCRHTCTFLHPRCHRIAELWGAGNRGIARVPRQGGLIHRLKNCRGRADVVIANGQHGDRFTRINQFTRTFENHPAIGVAFVQRDNTIGQLHQNLPRAGINTGHGTIFYPKVNTGYDASSESPIRKRGPLPLRWIASSGL